MELLYLIMVYDPDLLLLKNLFGPRWIDRILSKSPDIDNIKSYYKWNMWGYKWFINQDGFIHLSQNLDYFAPSNTISDILDDYSKSSERKILELGAGLGSNSIYLAGIHKNDKFYGLDLCNKSLKHPVNYHHKIGDYHDLSYYNDWDFDLIFMVESLSYSSEKSIVINEISKKLRPGGYFILFDYYLNKDIDSLDELNKNAIEFVFRSTSVNGLINKVELEDLFSKYKFRIETEKNLTTDVIHCADYFYDRLMCFFYSDSKVNRFLRKFIKLIPFQISQNFACILFLNKVLKKELVKYYFHVLRTRK